MTKDIVLTVRVPEELRDEITEVAEENGLSQSELIREAIEEYLGNGYSIPSKAELFEMEWDELCDLIDDHGLDIDPDDISTSLFTPDIDDERTDNLRSAIMTALDISDDSEEPEISEEE